jgi:hypothetical protein
MTVSVADAHAHVERPVLVVKMTTDLEDYNSEEYRFVVHLLWTKWLIIKNIHKEIFPVYDGNCLLRKAVYNFIEKFSQGRSKVADDSRPVAEVAEKTVKRLLCYVFRRTDK